MGHILEGAPNNLASQIQRRQGQRQYFFGEQESHFGTPAPLEQWRNEMRDSPGGCAPGGTYTSREEPAVYETQAQEEMDFESGTDTDTESDVDDEPFEMPEGIPADSSPDAVAEALFWAYTKAKGAWRKFMQKPVRKLRRFIRRPVRKGKGKFKGKGHKRLRKEREERKRKLLHLLARSIAGSPRTGSAEHILRKGSSERQTIEWKGKRPNRQPKRTRW